MTELQKTQPEGTTTQVILGLSLPLIFAGVILTFVFLGIKPKE